MSHEIKNGAHLKCYSLPLNKDDAVNPLIQRSMPLI